MKKVAEFFEKKNISSVQNAGTDILICIFLLTLTLKKSPPNF